MTNSYFAKANQLFREKKFLEAIDLYKKAVAEKKLSFYYLNMAMAYYHVGDIAHARECFVSAYELSERRGKAQVLKISNFYNVLDYIDGTSSRDLTGRLSVNELKTKLWGGFSQHALKGLAAVLQHTDSSNKDKKTAALVLARWYATVGDWGNSVEYTKKIKPIDAGEYRKKKTKLLLIEGYINTKEYDKAQDMIDFVISQRVDGDFYCALSNLIAEQQGHRADQLRLDALNEIYQSEGLAPLKLLDYSKGLTFGNIAYNLTDKKIENGPKVSVLVPVYGAEEHIEVAINSLLSQTWRNLEIIAVEDCSPDTSWQKLQELAKKDSRLKIYKNDKNMGAYPTRNNALSLATGDYITVHDSDDWSHPQMIEVQMAAMLTNPELKITCSAMTRVYPDLRFILRPQRENLEYIHRSYPSVLIRRDDLALLGEWDGVSANADDEFVQRARLLWGNDSVVDIMKHVPFSFFLVHENSLTQQAGTNLNTLTFGIRKEYSRQANYWREKHKVSSNELKIKRTSLKSPFPIPQGLAPKNWDKNTSYDLIIVSDLSLLGGTRRCNEGYIEAAADMGWRVGIFHWPRYDLKVAEVAKEYLELSYRDNVDILVPEDEVTATTVLIHHPPILNYSIDAVPKIQCEKVGILVNQSPMQLWSQKPFYYLADKSEQLVADLFGKKPTWIAISPRVIETLGISGGYNNIHSDIWYPPFNGTVSEEMPALPEGLGTNRKIILGRHARNHWTKWPADAEDIANAYCANSNKINVHLLGGAQTPNQILGKIPGNWKVFEFDTVDVTGFVENLDFFVHYTHEDYIEEFGRNIMEAMAAGRVAILPPEYQSIFGDAAVYAKCEQVESTVLKYWANKALYRQQVDKGVAFVKQYCSKQIVQKNLINFKKQ